MTPFQIAHYKRDHILEYLFRSFFFLFSIDLLCFTHKTLTHSLNYVHACWIFNIKYLENGKKTKTIIISTFFSSNKLNHTFSSVIQILSILFILNFLLQNTHNKSEERKNNKIFNHMDYMGLSGKPIFQLIFFLLLRLVRFRWLSHWGQWTKENLIEITLVI